jgi:hypothetical protein
MVTRPFFELVTFEVFLQKEVFLQQNKKKAAGKNFPLKLWSLEKPI